MASQQLPQPLATPVAENDYFIGGTSMTCNPYDLMYFDDTQAAPLNAASMPDQGTEALNQRYFAQRFRGVARDKHIVTDGVDNTSVGPFSMGIFPDFTGIFSCPSNTFEVGDLIAVRENSTTNGLQANVVTKTTDPDAAIGECVQKTGLTAVTQVNVRLRRPINVPSRNNKEAPLGYLADQPTTTGGSLKTSCRRIQSWTPSGAATISLPTESKCSGMTLLVFNRSSSNSMTFLDSFTSNTVGFINLSSAKLFICDGTLGTWSIFPTKT